MSDVLVVSLIVIVPIVRHVCRCTHCGNRASPTLMREDHQDKQYAVR